MIWGSGRENDLSEGLTCVSLELRERMAPLSDWNEREQRICGYMEGEGMNLGPIGEGFANHLKETTVFKGHWGATVGFEAFCFNLRTPLIAMWIRERKDKP